MGIDGIGKPGPGGLPGGVPKVGEASGNEFQEVIGKASSSADVAAADVVQPSVDLARLERGEISLDQYLEARVGEATSHLQSMPPDQLAFIRQSLREQMETDPVLIELVRRATGAIPVPKE